MNKVTYLEALQSGKPFRVVNDSGVAESSWIIYDIQNNQLSSADSGRLFTLYPLEHLGLFEVKELIYNVRHDTLLEMLETVYGYGDSPEEVMKDYKDILNDNV